MRALRSDGDSSRTERFIARAQQRDGLGGALAQIVRQVGKVRSATSVGRHDHEQLAFEAVVQRGEQVGPRRARRLVEREGVPALSRQGVRRRRSARRAGEKKRAALERDSAREQRQARPSSLP